MATPTPTQIGDSDRDNERESEEVAKEKDEETYCCICTDKIDGVYAVPRVCDVVGAPHLKFHLECLVRSSVAREDEDKGLHFQTVPICPNDRRMYGFLNIKCLCNSDAATMLPINLVAAAEAEVGDPPMSIIYRGDNAEAKEAEIIQAALTETATTVEPEEDEDADSPNND